MPDPAAVRRTWARRIIDEYTGWPAWPIPQAQAGRTASGWAWGVAPDEVEGLDLQLVLRQHTGETARVLRNERAYWGLDPDD